MDEDELRKMIEDVIADVIQSGELEAGENYEGEEEEAGEEEMEAGEEEMEETVSEEYDETMEESDSIEELNLDELLAELELEEASEEKDEEVKEELNEAEEETEEEEIDVENMDEDELKKMIEDVIADMIQSGELEAGENYEGEEEEAGEEEMEAGEEEMEDEEELAESEIDGLLAELSKKDKKDEEKAKMEEELAEAIDTIKTLQSQLNEVKLLNAKLLYTNKIFKARNLSESQKVKVLSTFDKATSIKEVELVFESITNSFASAKKEVVKESLGFASKPSGVS